MVEFFDRALHPPSPIPAESQVWKLRETATATSFVGGLLFVIGLTKLLLGLPIFSSVRQPTPQALLGLKPFGKNLEWGLFIFGEIAAAILFMPLAKATAIVFPEASALKQTWWFPQRINNALLL